MTTFPFGGCFLEFLRVTIKPLLMTKDSLNYLLKSTKDLCVKVCINKGFTTVIIFLIFLTSKSCSLVVPLLFPPLRCQFRCVNKSPPP